MAKTLLLQWVQTYCFVSVWKKFITTLGYNAVGTHHNVLTRGLNILFCYNIVEFFVDKVLVHPFVRCGRTNILFALKKILPSSHYC